jgi:EpsD family peptidyl-prolyl cis-trans isomerase
MNRRFSAHFGVCAPVVAFCIDLILVLLLLCMVGSASASDEARKSRVLATVNGTVITDADLDRFVRLSLKTGVIKSIDDDTRKFMLDKLIDMYVVEQATDKDRRVDKLELEKLRDFARLDASYNYYLDTHVSPSLSVSEGEAQKFIADHPQYFDGRRSFYFSNIEIVRNRLDVPRIKALAQMARRQFDNAKTLEERQAVLNPIIGYVQAVAGKLTHFRSWKASEQLGSDLFKHLSVMKEGDIVVDDESSPKVVRVIMLYASEANPLDPRESQSIISQGILHDKQEEAAKNLVGNLRAQADIRIGPAAAAAAVPSRRTGQIFGSTTTSKGFRRADLWIAWISALVLMLPASLISFHRQNIRARQEAYFVDDDLASLIWNRMNLFTYSPIFEVMLAFLSIAFAIVASAAMFYAFSLSSDPLIVGSMAASGIAFGVALSFLWWKYSHLLTSPASRNRWVLVLTILSVQAVGFVAALSAS